MTNAKMLFGKHKVFIVDYFHQLDRLGLEDNLYIVRLADDGTGDNKMYEWRDGGYVPFSFGSGGNNESTPVNEASIEVYDERKDLPLPANAKHNTLYVVLMDITAERKTTMYLFVDGSYMLLAAFSAGGSIQEYTQVTKLSVEANATAPRTYEIAIPRTTNFLRAPIEVLKFSEGNQEVVQTAMDFGNGDATDFLINSDVIFDGAMKLNLKTNIQLPLIARDDGLHTAYIDGTLKKKINNLYIDPTSLKCKVLFLHDGNYKKWNNGGKVKTYGRESVVPVMTSNTTPSPFVASASSSDSSSPPFKAFNGVINDNAANYWYSNHTRMPGGGHWLAIKLNNAKKIGKYSLAARYEYAPIDWVFEGSNSSSNWTTLDVRVGVELERNKLNDFYFDNELHYSNYRIRVTKSSHSSGYTIISVLNLYDFVETESESFWSIEQNAEEYRFELSDIPQRKKITFEQLTAEDKSGVILNGEIGRVWSLTINLDKFIDIVSLYPSNGGFISTVTDAISHYISINPNAILYSSSEDFLTAIETLEGEVEVLLYSVDEDLTEVSMQITANWSPLDELEGDFEIVTYFETPVEQPPNLIIETLTPPQFVVPVSDISIKSIENIKTISLKNNVSGRGVLKTVVSFDEGATYYTHDGSRFVEIPLDLDNVLENGITPQQLENIPEADWNALRSVYDTFRMAYALSIKDETDRAEADTLEFLVDMKGTWKAAVHGRDYDYEYPDNQTILVTLYNNGDYKMNV